MKQADTARARLRELCLLELVERTAREELVTVDDLLDMERKEFVITNARRRHLPPASTEDREAGEGAEIGMPHLKEHGVDVQNNLRVTYVSSPGSEMARWSNDGTKWPRSRVADAIRDALDRIDERRRELASALAAVEAIPYEFGTPIVGKQLAAKVKP